jgi:ribosomal protein L40E
VIGDVLTVYCSLFTELLFCIMFCIKCGADNLETAKFCRKCGEEVSGKQSAFSGQPAEQAA